MLTVGLWLFSSPNGLLSPYQSKITQFHGVIIAGQQKVEALEISVDDGRVARVQICHRTGYIQLSNVGERNMTGNKIDNLGVGYCRRTKSGVILGVFCSATNEECAVYPRPQFANADGLSTLHTLLASLGGHGISHAHNYYYFSLGVNMNGT